MNPLSLVSREVLKEHARVSPWISLATTAAVYGAIFGVVWLAATTFGWWFTPIAIVLIGCLQHYLFVLQHDASHQGLHPNRWVNDVLGDLLLAVPIGNRLKYYRALHIRHHKLVRDEGDPELGLVAGLRSGSLPRALLEAVTGITALRGFIAFFRELAVLEKEGVVKVRVLEDLLVFGVVWGGPMALSAYFGWLWAFLLYWLVPMSLVYANIIKLHTWQDHVGRPAPDATPYARSTTRRFGLVSDFVFNPLNAGEHLVHHMFASVPWYNLPSMARELEKNEVYRTGLQELLCDGYFFGRSTIWGRLVRQNPL